jgi:DNA-directed RNA polymerase specialized sigma subunit
MEKTCSDFEIWKQWNDDPGPESNRMLLDAVSDRIEYSVRKFSNSGIPEGVLRTQAKKFALQQAKTFDPNMGSNLNTHISHGLRKMTDFVDDERGVVRVPNYIRKQIPNFIAAKEQLEDRLKRPPSGLELSDHLKIGKSMISKLQRAVESKEIGETSSMLDVPDVFGVKEEEELIKTNYYDLKNDEHRVVYEYTFGLMGRPSLSPKEIAKKTKIPEYRVRRIQHSFGNEISKYLKGA